MTCLLVLLGMLLAAPGLAARGADTDGAGLQRYIVEFHDPPLVRYAGRQTRAGSVLQSVGGPVSKSAGGSRLDMAAAVNRDYLERLEGRHNDFLQEAEMLLGRQASAVYRYRVATNGMAVDLTPAEAAALARSPQLKSIHRDRRHILETWAGPTWIGSADIWSGASGFPESRGENIVVGIIDSGINWEHPSFDDPSPDGYVYQNPLGEALGLCDDPEVACNNKLIGVYDFVEDDPDTGDVVEENTKGRDSSGHGSLVASIAVGNRINVLLSGVNTNLSGVAPRANLVTYRVCYGDLSTRSCLSSAILAAVDQAVSDGVDVINYSIGAVGQAGDPWNSSVAMAFLNAREAGIVTVSSAGNSGPNPITITSPAHAPWVIAVGSATHDGFFGTTIFNLVGGAGTPPGDLVGASLTGGTGQLNIVHARDFGYPLCGTGEPELQAECADNEGLSNPWDGQRPFNGEIVVCDRGTYGRVEKGKNVLLAGAGGYILANTAEFGESTVSDEHCLPASHVGEKDGNTLRAWLAEGAGHGGRIGQPEVMGNDLLADQVDDFSSRGPGAEPVEDILKPNLIAPGSWILGAGHRGQELISLAGTSFSSPHVAGAVALLKSVHRDWSPGQLASAIEMTATPELANIEGMVQATAQDRGAGRPQLGEAANAGLFLEATGQQFSAADPSRGGDPKNLNLAGLVDSRCRDVCSFTRRVTDQMGGGDWTATPLDFPAGVSVTVVPESFTLGNGASRELTISVDVSELGILGGWVSGRVRLSAAGSADQFLTISVGGGDLVIEDDRNAGWQDVWLPGLAALPDATYRSGGLQPAQRRVEVLVEDLTPDDPYDGGEGVFTEWHELPEGGLWLFAETLRSSAEDLDLYVGRDDNGNGAADAAEELCSSISPTDLERCDLFDLPAGDYWILVQNFGGTFPSGDEATLLSAGIGPGADNTLVVTGPGIVKDGESYELRLSWDDLAALPGEEWFGALGIGSDRDHPNNVSVIPVRFNRSGIAEPSTFPLFDGVGHRLALAQGSTHDRLFIDVPPGVASLAVSAHRIDGEPNDGLGLELRRLDFTAALADPPFAVSPDAAQVIGSDGGSGESGPTLSVNGPQAGRWYAVLTNGGDSAAPVEIRASLSFEGAPLPIHRGLWQPSSRPNLRQGFDYNWGSTDRSLIWYSYDEAGQPAWYIAGSPPSAGNAWFAPLYRVTNDGTQQQLTEVGRVAVTIVTNSPEDEALFTFTLFGESGTDPMKPLSAPTCPQIDGSERSYTGIWSRVVAGLGGASVVVNAQTQAQIHYVFDDAGEPRWLVAQDLDQPEPTNPELPMLQFSGYCAVCEGAPPSYEPMGVLTRDFSSETAGSWTLDYLFREPLSGSVQRTDQIVKLTSTLDCP